jgi:interferon gamma-inducible protein 30
MQSSLDSVKMLEAQSNSLMMMPHQTRLGLRGRLRDIPFLILSALVVLLTVALVFEGISSHSESSSVNTTASGRVRVDFYGESLCPDCRHMVLDVLKPMLSSENGLAEHIDLRYVAYGNVQKNSDGSIQCQHGEVECLYNRYINCAQQDGIGTSEMPKWFGYVECMAKDLNALRSNGDERSNECAVENGLSAIAVRSCATGDKGKELEKQAGIETDALIPKHKFVPWIVVNGAAIGSDFENLDRYICVALDLDPMPAACLSLPRGLDHQ